MAGKIWKKPMKLIKKANKIGLQKGEMSLLKIRCIIYFILY